MRILLISSGLVDWNLGITTGVLVWLVSKSMVGYTVILRNLVQDRTV